LFFFNDNDEAQLHGASGITRNFQPKPAFYAMSQLYRTLGDYRLSRIVAREEGKLYCFEYDSPRKAGDKIFVAWSPTGLGQSAKTVLPIGAANVYRAERMQITAGLAPKAVEWRASKAEIEIEVSESPVFIWSR
jgi:hypothetical protein